MLYEITNSRCSYEARNFKENQSKVVLEIEHLVIPRGKKIFIVGESGIGKSTILEVLGMMNKTLVSDPQSQFVFYADASHPIDLNAMWDRHDDEELSSFRRQHFNFIFQSTNLMRNFTAFENISFTRMMQGYSKEESFAYAHQILADLQLEHIDETRMAQELSGGQQQRLAFARAIMPDFTVLFGDEPTGNLDPVTARLAMELLNRKLVEREGSSAIIVSHDMNLAVSFADVVVKIAKLERPRKSSADDVEYYGRITDKCVYVKDAAGNWSNGFASFSNADFETFLRKGDA